MRPPTPASALLLALALALLPPLAAAEVRVEATDDGSGGGAGYRFVPRHLEAAPGEALLVENTGAEPHTLTHDAPPGGRLFHTGAVEPGGTGNATAPEEPGDYEFVCVFHPEMRGTLTVAAGQAPATPTPPGADATTTTTTTTTTTAATPPTLKADPFPGVGAVLAAVVLAGLLLRRGR